ncbi:Hypothetical predicted protein [Cloeon dipterum]|uniref:Uncharacterized protein n=1 Tax=Cloeon dipterum TaxID=197152 RepID=A0A8S1CVU0_9INSE|nr:Hypothetical predicted protein [Cloeon dipterum]
MMMIPKMSDCCVVVCASSNLACQKIKKAKMPPDKNMVSGPHFLIEWIDSRKKEIAKASNIKCLDVNNPIYEKKKYNVVFSPSTSGGKLVHKSAIIVQGPGTFQELKCVLKEQQEKEETSFGDKRPARVKRLPLKSLESASEDYGEAEQNNRSKKNPPKKPASQIQLELLKAIDKSKACEDNNKKNESKNKKKIPTKNPPSKKNQQEEEEEGTSSSSAVNPVVFNKIFQQKEWDFSGVAFAEETHGFQ